MVGPSQSMNVCMNMYMNVCVCLCVFACVKDFNHIPFPPLWFTELTRLADEGLLAAWSEKGALAVSLIPSNSPAPTGKQQVSIHLKPE